MTDKHQRLAEVIGTLNAYRQGWIVFERQHVRQLQRERIALLAELA